MSTHPADGLLHGFIDRRWREWADRTALDIPPGRERPARLTATYADLVGASHHIQSYLSASVTPDAIVAILLPRAGIDAFASILAILRAGGAYLAIDPVFPDGRVRQLLDDARPVATLTDAAGRERLETIGALAGRVLRVDIRVPTLTSSPASPDRGGWSPPSVDSASLAYVIYTSGTTGRPKGVMVEHRAIANLVESDIHEFTLGFADRVAQGSSLAYDSSVEEMWLAFAAGATLVIQDDDAVRLGPDLVPWLERERISVWCPPPTLLRAAGVRELDGQLPNLRLIYAGGEALPEALVRIWAPGRRFVNGYGPTECAVVATRGDVLAGGPVSIGRPVPNVTAHVLDAAGKEVASQEPGELHLGGAGLARGYWGLPALTATQFPHHPRLGRIYRTGDLVRRSADGELFYLGRADSQVKIRGHRVELEEIETRLTAIPGVRMAAARLQSIADRETLVAFVVPEAGAAIDPPSLRDELQQLLPAHMVPAHIGVIPSLPTTAGGKLDRAALPSLDATGAPPPSTPGRRLSESEAHVARALEGILGTSAAIDADAHFFSDLGGDSLFAADLVTALRESGHGAGLTVRDAYEAPTIASLAARLAPSGTSAPVRQRPSLRSHPGLVTVIQCAWLAVVIATASSLGYLAVFVGLTRLAGEIGPVATALALPVLIALLSMLYLPFSIAMAVLTKRLCIGRYMPRREAAWSSFYARNWIVRQALRLVPWRLIEGTVFHLAALRALGAKIGRRVHIHRGVDLLQGGWDLLEIGDDATIGQEALIQLVDLDDEQIVVAPVVIGPGATVDIRAIVGGGAVIEENGFLTALSSLPSDTRLPRGECWDGVPAKPAGQAPPAPAITLPSRAWPPAAHGAAMVATRIGSSLAWLVIVCLVTAWLMNARGLTGELLASWLRGPVLRPDAVVIAVAAGLAPAPLSVLAYLALIRLLGTVPSGVLSRWSFDYFRVWAKTDLVRKAGDWLSGTLMWPLWLRAAGMRIGRNCEISTIIDVVPELVTIQEATFCADGIYLGGPRVHRGTVALEPTYLGSNLFLGNHVVIPAGSTVSDGVLLGVCTVADAQAERPQTAWFGHPPFALARPPQPALDRRLTHKPSSIRYANRWCWELARLAVPIVPALILLWLAQLFVRFGAMTDPTVMALVVTPWLVVLGALASCAVVLALKWILLGRVKPGEHPLWSCWCSRWDFHYTLWDRVATPVLAKLEGTLLLAWYLRAMGMRIGRRVVLGSGFAQVVDPDMIQIEDGATVHALFQAHTFEDRLLKIDRIRIGARATVGSGAVLLYGAEIGEGASVAPQSVIMKREKLEPGRRFEGCPSSRADRG